MADPTLRVRQTLDNTPFKKGLKESQSVVGKLKSSIGSIGPAVAAAFSIASIMEFGKQAVMAWDAQEKANNKLYAALKGNSDATRELINQSNTLAGTTLFADDEIVNAQAMLALFIKDTATLKQLTPLVLDFASATGKDLNDAARIVSKAFAGEAKSIKGTSIELEGAAGSSERLTSLTNELTLAVGGQAEMAAKTGAAAIQQMNKAWGEFAEAIGGVISPALANLATGLTQAVDGVTALVNSKSLKFWDKLKVIWGAMNRDVEAVSDVVATEYDPAMEEATFTEQKFIEVTEDVSENLEEQAKAAENAAKEIRKLNQESIGKISKGISPITTDELLGSQTAGISDQQAQILEAFGQVGNTRLTGFQLPTEEVEEFDMALRELPESYMTTVNAMVESSDRLKGAFEEIGAAVGTAIGEFIKGEAKFSDVAGSLLQEIIKIVAGYLAETVAASFAGGASVGGPAAPFSGAAAAAAALSMFGSIVPALMATGGTVPAGFPNDTYPALLSSGETVLPEPRKLDGMFGNQVIVLDTRIKGNDIWLSQQKTDSKLSRYR